VWVSVLRVMKFDSDMRLSMSWPLVSGCGENHSCECALKSPHTRAVWLLSVCWKKSVISSVSVSAVDVDLGGMYTLVSVRVFLVEICMLIIWASTVCC